MREEKGQDLVEFALIAPVLFLLLFGILEFGVIVWRYNTLSQAAREGARAAAVYYVAGGEQGRKDLAVETATNYARSLGRIEITVDAQIGEYAVKTESGANTERRPTIDVTTSYLHSGMTRLFSLQMQSNSSMIIE